MEYQAQWDQHASWVLRTWAFPSSCYVALIFKRGKERGGREGKEKGKGKRMGRELLLTPCKREDRSQFHTLSTNIAHSTGTTREACYSCPLPGPWLWLVSLLAKSSMAGSAEEPGAAHTTREYDSKFTGHVSLLKHGQLQTITQICLLYCCSSICLFLCLLVDCCITFTHVFPAT